MKLKKWHYSLAIIPLVLVAISMIASSVWGAKSKPALESFKIEPAGPAQKQTKTIPVQVEMVAHPSFYIYQGDDGSWALDRNMSSSTLTKGPNGPYYLPSKQKAFVKINSSNPAYLPNKVFEDSAKNPYPVSLVKNQKIVWSDWKKASDDGAEPAGDLDFVAPYLQGEVWLGGDYAHGAVEQYGDTGPPNFKPKYKTDYPINMILLWGGEVKQDKEIRITPNTFKLAKGATAKATAQVKTTGYQAADWTNVTSNPDTHWFTDNDSVFRVDSSGNITAKGKGTATLSVEWTKDKWHLRAEAQVAVDEDLPPTGGGNNGSGGIMFTPDNTEAFEPPIVRGWARRDFQVTAHVVNYKPVDFQTTVTGTQEYDATCSGTDAKGKPYTYTCTKTRSVTIPYSWHQEADVNNIKITGDATGTNQVTMTKEGDNLRLHGRVDWLPGVETWNLPPRTTATKPTPPPTPPPIEGDSGIYKLDKQKPTQTVTPTSHGWTNQPIVINIVHKDNLSGFYKTDYLLTNISYYANGGMLDFAKDKEKLWTPTLTIAQQGVYILETHLGDYAGWPEVLPDGPQYYKFEDYRFDAIPPYPAEFSLGNGGVQDGVKFDYIVSKTNTVKVRVGDDLSGTVKTEFSWSKSPSIGSPAVNNWNGGWNEIPVSTPDYATGPNQMSGWVDVNLNSKTQYDKDQSIDYADMKEGTWYLHIRQTDRAGNVTHNVSPPIFINKLKNLRVYKISDFAWKSVFLTPTGNPTGETINGIGVKDMPIYTNKQGRNVSLGYGADYKFDTVGFDGPNDKVLIKLDYHGLDTDGNIRSFQDVYVENKEGKFIKMTDSEYSGEADLVTFSNSINGNKKQAYESSIKLNQAILPMFQADTDQTRYATWAHRTFLPPTTKFVKKDAKLDLIKGTNMDKYRELVTFTIEAYRQGHSQPLRYTQVEDQWAALNVWGTDSYNNYGRNRPTGRDLLGFGPNKGEVIWFDLQKTLKDDLKFFREW